MIQVRMQPAKAALEEGRLFAQALQTSGIGSSVEEDGRVEVELRVEAD
jgi:hypothetical protein